MYPFRHGLMAEINQLRWEKELLEKELSRCRISFQAIRGLLENNQFDEINNLLINHGV